MSRFFSFLFCLGMTLLFLICIGSYLIDQLTFVQRAPTAFVKGVMTKVTLDSSGPDDDASCNALVKFSPKQKHSREISYGLSSWSFLGLTNCNGQVGDVVDVAYHIADPNDARVLPPGGFLLGNWIWFIALIFVLLVGGTLTWSSWSNAL